MISFAPSKNGKFFFCEAVSELRTVGMIGAIEVKEGVFQPLFDNIAS